MPKDKPLIRSQGLKQQLTTTTTTKTTSATTTTTTATTATTTRFICTIKGYKAITLLPEISHIT